MRDHFYSRAALALVCTVTLLGATAPLAAQRGAITKPLNLEQMAQRAESIVRATVTSARVERHPEFRNLWTVVVTLRVQQTLKGDHEETLTFRQFIWDIRDRHDAAGYRKGQDLVLLLGSTSRYGLTSPVGMEQGRFRVVRGPAGQKLVVNGHGNAGLFRGMAERGKQLDPLAARLLRQERASPIEIQQFTELLQQLVRSAP